MVRSSTRDSCTKKPECRSKQEEGDGRGNRRAAPINQRGGGGGGVGKGGGGGFQDTGQEKAIDSCRSAQGKKIN